MVEHIFHFIGGPGGTGKSALFKKLHAACRMKGLLISICAPTRLAALLYEGATTAHSLFRYPVEDDVARFGASFSQKSFIIEKIWFSCT